MIDETRLAAIKGRQLGKGSHSSIEHGMCVMEAVSYVAGEPWSDRPACASPTIGAFLRTWNDALPDDEARTRLLGPLIPRLPGTAADDATELRRSYMALDWMVRVMAPAWLELAGLGEHAALLRDLGEICDELSVALAVANTRAAREAARKAAWDAAREARDVGAAEWDAAWAAAWGAGAAAWAVRNAAWDAVDVWDAAWAAAWAAAWNAAWDAAWNMAAALQLSALELIDRMIDIERPAQSIVSK